MPAAGGEPGVLRRLRGGVRHRAGAPTPPRPTTRPTCSSQGILDGNTDRESLLEWVNDYDGDGITKTVKFDETGEVENISVWAYKVEGGEIVADQEIETD